MPGGRLTAKQYLGLDAICDQFANGTLRITTRETFQFHCIIKPNMKPFIQQINALLLSTLGGCGDVVRNVITCPAPIKDNIHAIIARPKRMPTGKSGSTARRWRTTPSTQRPTPPMKPSRFTAKPTCRANLKSPSASPKTIAWTPLPMT